LYCSDYWGAAPLPANPIDDESMHSFIDPKGHRLVFLSAIHTGVTSGERGYRVARDGVIGKYFKSPGPVSAGPGYVILNSATLLDTIQGNGVGTIAFIFKGTDFSLLQTIVETNLLTSSNAGLYVAINATTRTLNCQISGPAATARFGASSTAALTSGVWNHCAVVYGGTGVAVRYFVTPLSNVSDPVAEVKATVTGSNGSYPAGRNVCLGHRQAPDNGCAADSSFEELILSTATWTDTQINNHFRYCQQLINSGW
jgi:hypothetical protein